MGFLNELGRAFANGVREGLEESRQEVTVTSAQQESLQIVNKLTRHRDLLLNRSRSGDPEATLLLGMLLFHILRTEEVEPIPGQADYDILLLAAALCHLADYQGGEQERSTAALTQFIELFQTGENQSSFIQIVLNEEFKHSMTWKFLSGENYDIVRQVLAALDE